MALRPSFTAATMANADALARTVLGGSIAGTLDYAAPEQLGKLPGAAVGPYSDVYGFGRTCCYALFGTPQPGRKHWQSAPAHLANLLSDCQSEQPRDRPADFTAVLRDLNALAPAVPSSLPQTAWETACRQDTAESYEGYLSTFPGGAHAEEARRRAATELRGRLRNDWSNKPLRARYLAVRTSEWRQRNGKPWEEWHGRAPSLSAQAGAVLGTLLGFWLGTHAGNGLAGMLALTALGPLCGAVVVVGGWMSYIRASERRLGSFETLKRIGDELGPVRLDTPAIWRRRAGDCWGERSPGCPSGLWRAGLF